MRNTITEKGTNNSKTLELTQMGVMIAIICVATMVIKVPTVMGIAYRGDYNGKNMLNNLFAFIIAGIWMVFGYFVAKIILVKYVLFRTDSTKEAITLASASVPNNIGQFVVGIIIALFLIKLLNGRLNIVNNKKIEL